MSLDTGPLPQQSDSIQEHADESKRAGTLTLYCVPGESSQAPHILLYEAGLSFDAVGVDPHAQRTDAGQDFRAINPDGGVPALELPTGTVIGQVPAILQYVAELVPDMGLLPHEPAERCKALAWLDYIATEIHRGFSMLFEHGQPDQMPDEVAKLRQQIDLVDHSLHDRAYLMGARFTAPDAYLYVVTGWLPFIGLELNHWRALQAFRMRVHARPSVQAMLTAEGFVPARATVASQPRMGGLGGASTFP